MSLEILYEDKYIIAVLKEAGIPVQPDSSGDKALSNEVEEYCKKQCYLITRLDRPVGGISLFAKDSKTAGLLSQNINDLTHTEKIYTAVVCGNPKDKGRIENYIFKNQRTNMSKIVNKGNIGAKKAALSYSVIARGKDTALVKINLETGRHHQIRVQFAHMGYPLYGDTKYNDSFRHKRGITPALFASELKLIHPVTREEITIKAKENEIIEFFEKLNNTKIQR